MFLASASAISLFDPCILTLSLIFVAASIADLFTTLVFFFSLAFTLAFSLSSSESLAISAFSFSLALAHFLALSVNSDSAFAFTSLAFLFFSAFPLISASNLALSSASALSLFPLSAFLWIRYWRQPLPLTANMVGVFPNTRLGLQLHLLSSLSSNPGNL